MKKRIILTSLLFFLGMCIFFVLKLNSINTEYMQNEIAADINGVSSTEIANITSDNSTIVNSTNTEIILENATNINNATNVSHNSTEVNYSAEIVHYGSHYENGYSSGSVQITNGGTPMQASTNSKSQYTNGY